MLPVVPGIEEELIAALRKLTNPDPFAVVCAV
jgi:hypothetical protein